MKYHFIDPFIDGVKEGYVFAGELFVAIVLAIPRAMLAANEKSLERMQLRRQLRNERFSHLRVRS